MRQPKTVKALEELGRTRLSTNFFMRDFLYSEIAALHGFTNIPDDPDLAIAAGTALCETLLEPLQDRFGRLSIRSPTVQQRSTTSAIPTNSIAAAMKPTTQVTSGTAVIPKTAWAPPPASSSTASFPIMSALATGRPWLGGYMTTCHTQKWNSSPVTPPSICAGAKTPSAASTVSSHPAAAS